MDKKEFDLPGCDVAWCPGCGNFGILNILKTALAELEVDPVNLVLVSGIGQAAKLPHYLKCNVFNGLHGRALPPATAIKAVNPELTVIAESGDGDMYGEGGNHLTHCIRRNPDITNIIHDNRVYGLTKGQASPTSRPGFKTPVQVDGVISEPFNPLASAIALNASFVARAFSGDIPRAVEIVKQAISHKGYAMVDMLQPCVTFNRENTLKWYQENTYYLGKDHDPADRQAAFAVATAEGKLPLGVVYHTPARPSFEELIPAYTKDHTPAIDRGPDLEKLDALISSKGT